MGYTLKNGKKIKASSKNQLRSNKKLKKLKFKCVILKDKKYTVAPFTRLNNLRLIKNKIYKIKNEKYVVLHKSNSSVILVNAV